jgi:hypothetical protein
VAASVTAQIGTALGMEVKYFDSADKIMEYTSDEKYEIDKTNKPGVCFGVSVQKSDTGNYEV